MKLGAYLLLLYKPLFPLKGVSPFSPCPSN